jgi:glycerophosphoryl diester phosphodiesterase
VSPPRLYAHRGAAAELPENTLPSFRRALDLGADAIETDAHLTKDGHVVLSHDPTGARMCGVRAAIARATLDEVRTWDAGVGFRGASGARSFAGQGYRIPTLDEALRAFPDTPFNVDAKSRHPEMVARLLDVVSGAKATERTLVASFDVRTLREVRRRGFAGKTGLAQAEVMRLLVLPVFALTIVPLRGSAAQIPYRAYGIDLGKRSVVERCHALGLEVHYWTVNDAPLATRLLDLGADALMTDDPRALSPVVERWRAERSSNSAIPVASSSRPESAVRR